MKKTYIWMAVIAIVVSVGMIVMMQSEASADLEEFVDERTTREVVSELENTAVGGRIIAVAHPDVIELTYLNESNDAEQILNLYDDNFYVSIAPFIDQTHPCTFHVFPGCQAELVAEEIQVRIVDSVGNVVFDDVRQTYQNGFMGFWLPRNEDYIIVFEFGEYGGTFNFSTYEDSPTCLTEFQLTNVGNIS